MTAPESPRITTPDGASAWGPPRTKTVTWYAPAITAAAGPTLSGIDFLRAIRDGRLPQAPIAVLLGTQIREIELGKVVFECEPDGSVYNPIGVVHRGLVCTRAETVAACAVHLTLDVGFAYTSIDLNVSYLRAVTREGGVLRATGLVTKPGRRVAFSSVEIRDSADTLVATATSSCLVIDLRQ
jgi:uncharacterized protein (TIGR00369 family)